MAKSESRRAFFINSGRALALTVTGGAIWGSQLKRSEARAGLLRPPGAKAEKDFSAACIKCGQCVDACPFGTLSLVKSGDDGEIGTPFFEARSVPCYMCEDIPCARACPSGALDREAAILESEMGLAVLLDEETCIAFQGLRCEVCYRACPLIDKAITLNYRTQERTGKHAYFEPVVHSDACTGCGLCEHVCILEESAIRVLPRNLAQGVAGTTYRLGWKEKTNISSDFDSGGTPEKPSGVDTNLKNALDSLNDDGTLYE